MDLLLIIDRRTASMPSRLHYSVTHGTPGGSVPGTEADAHLLHAIAVARLARSPGGLLTCVCEWKRRGLLRRQDVFPCLGTVQVFRVETFLFVLNPWIRP